jgi:23S rRNA (adenine2503-C2)-methyltransferase
MSGAPEAPERLLELYRPDLHGALGQESSPSYRYRQVFEHLMRQPMQPFARATTLPAELRSSLDELGDSSLRSVGSREARDGTVKLLLSGRGDSFVETVVMPYQRRTTVCVSSQVGCQVGCAFCATGAMGFRRNLAASEIVDQVRAAAALTADNGGRVSNVVYMGEPLLNLRAVLSSIRLLTDPRGMDLSHRAISVSTVGIPSGIARLGQAQPQVNLAISLHASSDRARALLIPGSQRHSIAEILAAAWEHFALTRRKLLIEYVLLAGVNDSLEDARRLAGLLRGHVVTVNLLSWNPVRPPDTSTLGRKAPPTGSFASRLTFRPSPSAAVAAFRDALLNAHIEVVVRQSKGVDIEAACGQLAGQRRSYDGMTKK